MHARIGELLGRVTPLSDHDVSEILETQGGTRRRFGDIAIAWGLCKPQQVWWAWAEQCATDRKPVDLTTCGIDSAAVTMLPHLMAEMLCVIAIRGSEDELIIAAASPADELRDELSRHVQKRCRIVLADATQIRAAIAQHYRAA